MNKQEVKVFYTSTGFGLKKSEAKKALENNKDLILQIMRDFKYE